MLPPLNRRLAAADLVAEACRSTKRSRDVGANASECEALQPARADVRNFDAGIARCPGWLAPCWIRSWSATSSCCRRKAARIVVDPRKVSSPGYRMAIHPRPVELMAAVPAGRWDEARRRARYDRKTPSSSARSCTGFPTSRASSVFLSAARTDAGDARALHASRLRPRACARRGGTDSDGTETFIGVARYAANPDRESAEFMPSSSPTTWHGTVA